MRHHGKHWHWRWKKAQVYSPIAVQGALFAAADSVSGTGVGGAASIDISFGYTGSYSATAHGLEPAVVSVDSVVQDPDQAFDPNDGFSTPHSVIVSGAALLRFAMPPEATDPNADLDLYLANPAGEIVAISGNGGTDEVIEVVAPADGEWVLWVHGWSVPADPTPYTLHSWVISQTPGGNLAIDNAPDSAIIGATQAIDVSWDGAAAGQWHYGIISHADDSAAIGITRVEVDNR